MIAYPVVDPVAVAIGPLKVHWYGLMYLFGIAAGWWLAARRSANSWSPITRLQLDDMTFYVAMGVVLGGRIGYVFFYQFDKLLHDPLWLFRVWEGGMSFHGGFLGVLLAMAIFARKSKKRSLEDFGQLLGLTREVKYNTSMENFAKVVRQHTTFPALECREFFLRTLFCFLTGNEDMHAKNFSLFSEDNQVFKLAPAYDFLNSTIVTSGKSKEELAVPLAGKKSKLTYKHLVEYFGKERLGLEERAIDSCLKQLRDSFPEWEYLIPRSFLSEEMKKAYQDLFMERRERLRL